MYFNADIAPQTIVAGESTCMYTRDRGMYLHEEVNQHEGMNLQVAQIPGPSIVGFVQMGVPSCERLRSAGMWDAVGMGRKGVLGWSRQKGEREGGRGEDRDDVQLYPRSDISSSSAPLRDSCHSFRLLLPSPRPSSYPWASSADLPVCMCVPSQGTAGRDKVRVH